ncbi:MAG: glycosyltransferase [Gemmatimonadetes bacterium]|nr:glycosyltransferase [Gemmatimonadota bacterium]
MPESDLRSRPLHVLTVSAALPSPGRPGSLAPLADQIRSLRDLGLGVSSLELTGRSWRKYVGGGRKLRAGLDTSVPPVDVIHAHHGYCGWVARSQFRCPVVVSFMGEDALGMPFRDFPHAAYYRAVALANRQLAARVSGVIVKSDEMRRALRCPAAHVVPNGVDLRRFRPRDRHAAREQLGWDREGTVVLFGADPEEVRKNFALARAAVTAAERRGGRPITLRVLRGVAHDEVPLHMNACDALLFTSRLEGSPNVVKEAMACNVPVVSVPVADVPSLFTDAEGYRIRDPTAEALAEGLLAALAPDAKQPRGVEVLRERGLTLEETASRIAEIYRRVVR